MNALIISYSVFIPWTDGRSDCLPGHGPERQPLRRTHAEPGSSSGVQMEPAYYYYYDCYWTPDRHSERERLAGDLVRPPPCPFSLVEYACESNRMNYFPQIRWYLSFMYVMALKNYVPSFRQAGTCFLLNLRFSNSARSEVIESLVSGRAYPRKPCRVEWRFEYEFEAMPSFIMKCYLWECGGEFHRNGR